MPKIEFAEGFKKKSAYDYPKLSLEQNEKARVCVIDNPEVQYVHNLRRVITVDGKPVMETQKYGKNLDRTREVPQSDFVGKFICLGDYDVLESKGVDPDNCPACKASIENSSAVDSARRRFVVHVIKYHTTKGTFNVQKPFQIELLAWEFAESRYGQLVDISTEHGSLPTIDLCLGPCTNANFQKFDMIPGGGCQWSIDEDRKAKTREVVAANRSEDLTPLLGRRVSPAELRSQVAEIIQAYNYAFGRPDDIPGPEANTNADNDLSHLLDEPAAETQTPETQTPEAADGDFSEPVTTAERPVKTQPPADEIEDLESLLSGL